MSGNRWPAGANDEAAQWWAELHAGPLSARRQRELEAWLASDARNARRLADCEAAWAASRFLADDPETLAWLKPAPRPQPAAAERPAWRRLWPSFAMPRPAAAFMVFVLAMLALALLLPQDIFTGTSVATGIGEQRTVKLADGSVIRLNTNTRIRIAYDKDLRLVHLITGEATFEVAHDADRPFEVAAGAGRVRALGTVFNVMAQGSAVTITVLEGRVAVQQKDLARDFVRRAPPALTAGQKLSYSPAGLISEIEPGDIRRIRSWQLGKIDLENASLISAIEEMNRYSEVKLVIGDDRLNRFRISGVFNLGDVDSMVAGLTAAYPIQALRRGNRIVLLAAPADGTSQRAALPSARAISPS